MFSLTSPLAVCGRLHVIICLATTRGARFDSMFLCMYVALWGTGDPSHWKLGQQHRKERNLKAVCYQLGSVPPTPLSAQGADLSQCRQQTQIFWFCWTLFLLTILCRLMRFSGVTGHFSRVCCARIVVSSGCFQLTALAGVRLPVAAEPALKASTDVWLQLIL